MVVLVLVMLAQDGMVQAAVVVQLQLVLIINHQMVEVLEDQEDLLQLIFQT